MKIPQRLAAIFTAAVILSSCLPVFAAETSQIPEDASLSESAMEPEDMTQFPIPDKAPAFHAHIEFRMGYTVIGTFTDFTPDITRIETLYSLDGENWQTGTEDWNLYKLDTDYEYVLKGLQNQLCFLDIHEPLKSYIAGKIDRFYLKLRITKENGLSYETQSAVIERSGLQPIPEGTECRALFSSSIAVREWDPAVPYRYRTYGRYQLTVPADATAEEITALLPDTLPVEIQLDNGPDFIAFGVVDCPVTWKPLSLPQFSVGESITILDAAEEILVPGGTQVSTPLGIFQLDEPLSLNNFTSTDEVRLVLNVCSEDKNLTNEQLPDFPKIGGAQGNEGNAGADNRDDSTESGQRPNLSPAPDNNQEEQQTDPVPASVAASAVLGNGRVPSTDEPASNPNPHLSQTVPDIADTFAGNQETDQAFEPSEAQAVADIKKEEKETAITYTKENCTKKSLLPAAMATAITAGGCIGGAAVYKVKRYRLFCRIAGKLRTILH